MEEWVLYVLPLSFPCMKDHDSVVYIVDDREIEA